MASLASAGICEPGGDAVEQVDTDRSVVFLTGTAAFKLYRSGRHQDVDHSTPEQRHTTCDESVRLNRKTAPMLYRGVRAVTRTPDGSHSLDGTGEVVDWLIEMQRFDIENRLDRLADRGALGLRLMARLGVAIAHLHELAEWRFDCGSVPGIAHNIQQSRARLRGGAPGTSDDQTREQLIEQCLGQLQAHAERLESRGLSGFVRRCHGDLRLRNVCMIDDAPVLFNCEIHRQTISCVDVMCDLAVLLTDLGRRGLERHANVVLNTYVERTDDIEGLALLPLFLSCQAAMLDGCTRVEDDGRDNRTTVQSDDVGLRYTRRLLRPETGRLVAIGGRAGSGKTTLARRLAAAIGPRPGALILNSGTERRRVMGVAPYAALGADGYSTAVTQRVYRSLAERASRVLQEGHAVIVDAGHDHPRERAMLVDVARNQRVPFAGLWLDAPVDTCTGRRTEQTRHVKTNFPQAPLRHSDIDTTPRSWAYLDATEPPQSVWRAAQVALAMT